LATSTHDTKRSEDLRARLNVLTETPRLWREAVSRFRRASGRLRRSIEGESAPSRNDEYLFYQSLLGLWPGKPPSAEERDELVRRLQGYMEKATHEAKQRTSWINPHPVYDEATRDFVSQTLRPALSNKFMPAFLALHAKIAPTGQYNALFQVALKLLSPGVPDIYQGQEVWDRSLVDPDNRRPVDYVRNRRLLAEIRQWADLPDEQWRERIETLALSPFDPRLKLLVTQKLLALRRDLSVLFVEGEYVPLAAVGSRAEHLVALGWRDRASGRLRVIAVIPRLVHGLLSGAGPGGGESVYAAGAWSGTHLTLPDEPIGEATCLFTRNCWRPESSRLAIEELLASFPLAVLRMNG
jgi:(1->4)-alpha-D-glucan 1-alpha-D-glucosylmutase